MNVQLDAPIGANVDLVDPCDSSCQTAALQRPLEGKVEAGTPWRGWGRPRYQRRERVSEVRGGNDAELRLVEGSRE